MTWYYALGSERQGPIDDAALDRLIAAGTVTAETLVWKAGMTDWQPLSQARPRVAPPAPVVPPPPAAVIPTPAAATPDTQPRFGTPAPVFTPAPAATPTPAPVASGGGFGAAGWSQPGTARVTDPDQLYARIVAENRRFAIGDVVGRAWQLVMDNFGLTVLTTAVVWLATVVPCLGTLATPMLIGGLYVFFLKLARGQQAEFGDAFAGFSDSFLPLFLCGVVVFVAMMLSMIPGFGLFFLGIFSMETSEGLGILFILAGWLVMLAASIGLMTLWMFSLALVADKGLDFWPAMQLSRRVASRMPLAILGLLVVGWLIVLAGELALCIGIFVALPVLFASFTLAYEELFGDRVRA
jgi:hypothetical protein